MHIRNQNSINSFPKSLLINHFKFGAYRNLSSRRDENYARHNINYSVRELKRLEEAINVEENNMKVKIATDPEIESANFEYKNEKSGLRIIHKINLLISLDKQDIIIWKTAFKELARICSWSEEIQIEVLKQITDINLQHQIGDASSADEFIYKIIKLKYNYQTAYKYQTQMMNIRQSNHFTIRAYLYEIQKVTQKLALCLDWNEHMTQEKIHELFLCGLDDSIKIEIMKYPSRDFNAIVNMLSEIEIFIINNIRKNIQDVHQTKTYDFNFNTKHNLRNNMMKTKTRRDFQNDNVKRSRFCKYHNTSSHDISECRAFKKKTSQVNKKNEQSEKTYALNEPKCKPQTIEIPVEVNGKKIDGLVDTGSVENYISEGAVNLTGIKTNNLLRKKMTEIGNGDIVEIEKESDLKFKLLNDINNYYYSKFYVMPNPNKQIILGMRFLLENDAVKTYGKDISI
ncbi:hypothetical protein DMUE_4387 [Dictyocoela muelleri]|nr:hypothetical protein DMUE_4387 [Dictyocoela muelleri]